MAELSDSRGTGTPLDLWFARLDDEQATWRIAQPGPSLDELGTRMSSIPRDFLDARMSLTAFGGDLGLWFQHPDVQHVLTQAQPIDACRRGAAVALWLWASEDIVGPLHPSITTGYRPRAIAALAFRLAPIVDPAQWLSDPERREEAARLFLLWSGFLPEGEDAATAEAMWQRHDSLRQNDAMRAMLADHQHRVEVTEALRAKAAREAAARYTHE